MSSGMPPACSTAQDESPSSAPKQLDIHLVIANIQKKRNVQALISTAIAFGVSSIHVVGIPSIDLNPNSPKNPLPVSLQKALILVDDTDDKVKNTVSQQQPRRSQAMLRRFAKWRDAVTYFQQHNISLVGVEIDARAVTVAELIAHYAASPQRHHHPQALALVMGNEGQGLLAHQMADCQHLVRLPQYGSGTASYNVYVAASLVLQRLHQYQMSRSSIASCECLETTQI